MYKRPANIFTLVVREQSKCVKFINSSIKCTAKRSLMLNETTLVSLVSQWEIENFSFFENKNPLSQNGTYYFTNW